HHHVRAVNVLRLMSFVNFCAHVPQPLRNRCGLHIRAGNSVAGREQNLGNAAHAAPADADEMDALEIAECDGHGRAVPWRASEPFGFASDSSRSTIFSTARGFASERARCSMSAILRGWSRREKISLVNRSGLSSS